MSLRQVVMQEFAARFGATPALVVRAPGRVNLIGEHTDYNQGFVLPMAIDRAIWIALRPRPDRRVVAHSLDMGEAADLALDGLVRGEGWAEYLKGVAWALEEAGWILGGWEGVVAGDVPVGAGLSSSAALEMATARAFAAASGLPWDVATMARIGQRAENEWVGMPCGIMDQMVSAGGRVGRALLLDCRTLDSDTVPLPREAAVVVLDTSTRRGLVGSAYSERRAACEAAARAFGVAALRDVSVERFEALAGQLDEVTRRRARHVVTESARVLAAVAAMRRGDAVELGRLMDASHASLRDDFEVSSPALEAMVACARQQDGCYGARLTGAGFAGCAIALVEAAVAESFARRVAACFREASGLVPAIYICSASNGAEVVYRA